MPRLSIRITVAVWCSLVLSTLLCNCNSDSKTSKAEPAPSPVQTTQNEPVEPVKPIEVPKTVEAPPPIHEPVVADANPDAKPTGPQPPRYAEVDWPHVKIDLNNKVVEIEGYSGISEGWLEQIICLNGTRNHESVLLTEAKPSHIHAALLLIGLEPGHPGWWKIDPNDPKGQKWVVQKPTGSAVSITVAWTDKQAEKHEIPIREWVRDFHTHNLLPEGPWIFGGSMMKPDYTGKTVYVADHSGSIAGLVTFGDELLGWNEILPDEEAVMAPEWEANTPAMPEPFTPVTIRLRPASGQ